MPKTILMADDEPDIFKVVKVRLVKQGYDVLLARNGREAVEMAKAHRPDLIIMDYLMPELNGLEAVAIIKEDADLKGIPVIMMSASSNFVTADGLKNAAVDAYIPKPFEGTELMDKINRLLKSSQGA